jgi:hypothetical protein
MNLLVIYTDDENKILYYFNLPDDEIIEWAKRVDSYVLGYGSYTEEQLEDAYNFLEMLDNNGKRLDTPFVLSSLVTITTIHAAL